MTITRKIRRPSPIKAVIGTVARHTRKLAWDVSLAPDNATWLTVYAHEVNGQEPQPGEVLIIIPPQVIGIEGPK